ncbi:MAG: hypothetical protein LLG09_04220 [Negativicutes bacterium]|nr:hypothetical protein [Negativicutes bacterium]
MSRTIPGLLIAFFGAFICVMDIFAVINSGFDLTCLMGFLMGGGILYFGLFLATWEARQRKADRKISEEYRRNFVRKMQSEGFLPLPALAFQKNEFGQDKYAVYFKPDDSKLKLVVNKGFGKPQELDIDQGVLSDLVCSAVLRYKNGGTLKLELEGASLGEQLAAKLSSEAGKNRYLIVQLAICLNWSSGETLSLTILENCRNDAAQVAEACAFLGFWQHELIERGFFAQQSNRQAE